MVSQQLRFGLGMICFLLLAELLSILGCKAKREALPSVDQAMQLYREGDSSGAMQMLRAIEKGDPQGRLGDEAALILGNLLIGEQMHDAAVPFLQRAEKGQEALVYARLLLIKAIAEGGIADQYRDAIDKALQLTGDSSGDVSDFVKEEASYLLVKLFKDQSKWPKAADSGKSFMSQWPKSKRSDETCWMVAESLDRAGQARDSYGFYSSIWYETPSSAWAKQAQKRLLELEKGLSLPPRRLEPEKRFEFINALQKAGLHQDALIEIEKYLAGANRPAADRVLLLKAISLHAIRKNDECVRAVEQLIQKYHKSKWIPSAGIYAIRALRRSDNEAAVRKWTYRIHDSYPGNPMAFEALYNLGVFLQNMGKQEEGTQILLKVVQEGPNCEMADDSLWKVAWAYKQKGDIGGAVATLRHVLDRYPNSGFRKSCLYWIARFTAGQDPGGAKEHYQTLMREYPNDYYGHEASKNLLALGDKPHQLGNGEPFPSIDRLDRVDSQRGHVYNLAVHLKEVGLYEFAARELQRQQGLETDLALQFALADLYSRAGATIEAYNVLKRRFNHYMVAGSRDPKLVPMDFWYVAYPFNYRGIISRAILEAKLDRVLIEPPLVAALIKMESQFKATAVSPVGAVGLMQLMPDTAEQIAKGRNLPPPTRADLFRADMNIRYGTFFLAERTRDFGGEWFPAICSYNAGVGPVRAWWNKKPPEQPIDEFIETIPYVDTRLYIKQILGDFRNYEWIYKQRR